MFWTNFVKTIAKVLLVVSLLATLIAFLATVRGVGILAGLLTLAIGIIASFVSISGIMLVCEISENIAAIKNHLTGTSPANNTDFNFNNLAQNLGFNLNQNNNVSSVSAQSQSAPVSNPAPVSQPAASVQNTVSSETQSDSVNLSK